MSWYFVRGIGVRIRIWIGILFWSVVFGIGLGIAKNHCFLVFNTLYVSLFWFWYVVLVLCIRIGVGICFGIGIGVGVGIGI